MCATNLACFFACFRCTECIESIYACTFSGVGARFEQVEERGGPSVQWPFEKFVKEMHKAILNDCDESRLVFGVEVVTLWQEERKDELYATWRVYGKMMSF